MMPCATFASELLSLSNRVVLFVCTALALLTPLLFSLSGFELSGMGWSLTAAGAIATFALAGAITPADSPHRIGSANAVTALRGSWVVLLIAVAVAAPKWGVESAAALGLGLACLLADGVDGALARKTGTHSAHGARFDMEVDALLILVLSIIAWRSGQVGIWVLLSGLIRYAFVVASVPFAWLRAPLPSSRRRQTVCVWQVSLLLASVAPFFSPNFATAFAAVGLTLLTLSFAIDIRWLWRNQDVPRGEQ
ncbi:MAG: CDP-alcohol phosphatidyltransferase family protein [Gammaproteobacteria bacterium]|nr:CDP-alcohol phosphatidyltransferase family protein [Gammaproteobacteria bacterium]